jgi:hypothetical protein
MKTVISAIYGFAGHVLPVYAQVQYMCLRETRDDQRRPAVKCAVMPNSNPVRTVRMSKSGELEIIDTIALQ